MGAELGLLLALGSPALLALVIVPVAIKVAMAVDCYDRPGGYKAHGRATPYLGGVALLIAFLPGALVLGAGTSRLLPIVACAIGLAVVGTIDDRRPVPPLVRVAAEAVCATVLWQTGLGWSLVSNDVANLLITIVWVVGVVNAFNLMDNMDGATSAVVLASGAGITALAVITDDVALAALTLCVCGACAGFLRYNLASPARIFLGDGGSMWLGFTIAGATMALRTADGVGWPAMGIGFLLVGVPAVDTALVILSRSRRGISVLTGGRDHLSHRLRTRLPSARAVAAALAAIQASLCGLALILSDLGRPALIVASLTCVAAAGLVVLLLDMPAWQSTESLLAHDPTPGAGPNPAAERCDLGDQRVGLAGRQT